MKDNIKIVFDLIGAEDNLKKSTLDFLQTKMQSERKNVRRKMVQRVALVFASFFLLLFSYNIYFSKTMYIDIDINPSIELVVNRFDRVIGVHAYNEQGEAFLTELSVMHQSYESVLRLFTELAIENGLLSDGGLVSVTLQSEDKEMRSADLKDTIVTVSQGHHTVVDVEAFSVDSETRHQAHGLNLTPAKYLSILALQEIDPTASMEGCRGHTIGEIRALTKEHHNKGRHGNKRT